MESMFIQRSVRSEIMLSKFSVKKPYTVLVGVILVIVLGIVSFTRMTTDLLPSISLPYVIVMTTYPGASPETVETVVTKPVESSMATVSNIESISSASAENYSLVIMEFSQTADMNGVSLEIRENLDQIKSYWDDSVGNPIIMKLNPDMLPVMIAAVGMDGMDHGELSTYVEETIVPELESIEGVASVSTSGLLEESVNVVIQPDKVDALNQKLYAAIDEKLQEAAEEIEEGRQQIADGEKELADGKKEILKGQQELDEGKAELEEGKTQLDDKKAETAQTLASTKNQLLTAKINLESTRTTLATNLTTAKALQSAIDSMNAVFGVSSQYAQLIQKTDVEVTLPEISISGSDSGISGSDISISGGDIQANLDDTTKAEITVLKSSYLGNSLIKQAAGADESVASVIQELNDLDWTDPDHFATVTGRLTAVDVVLGIQLLELQDNLSALTNGMGYTAYEQLVNESNKQIEAGLAQVNSGLLELEKGQLTAAIEFANAATQISLGELQMTSAQTQLDAAMEQIESGETQLEEAKEQLEEGEKQLEESRQEAYDSANLVEIITVETVEGLLTAQNFSMPAGYVTEEGVSYLVRVGDKPETVEELQILPLLNLHMDGLDVITLEDVADIFYTDNSADIYTNVNGSAGCMLTIQKQTGYSTGEVSDLLSEKFEELMESEEGLNMITLMDQGIYIDLVMDSIIDSLLIGAALAVVILIFFLRDIRPTLVIALSIPISLVTAIVCMYFSGVTLNIISLSGLALGIGMLVDNSIVVIENIYRLRGEGYSMKEAAVYGAKEVAGAIMASTLTTVCVFLPIVFMEGITRQLFVDMGLTIAYSLLASLVIALTVVPAMASKVLVKTKEKQGGRILNGMINGYGKLLGWSLKVKPLILILAVVLLGASIALAWTNGTAFMSDMDSTQLTVTVSLDEDATLAETGEVTDQVVERLLAIDDVVNVGAMSSSSSSMSSLTGATSANSTTIYVVTDENKTRSNDEIADMIREVTGDLDAEISIDTSSMDMSALGGSGISIQIRGRDLDTLQEIATEVAAIVESVEGTAEVSDGMEESGREFRITIDKDKAIDYGLTVAQVYTQIAPKLASASSSTVLAAADKDYNIYVEHAGNAALTRALVKDLEITGTDADGKEIKVALSEIADFADTTTLSTINRADQSRYITVSASLEDGYNVGKVSTVVEQKLENYELPEGYSLVYSGENETINEALGQVMLMLVLAVVFMYLIMVAQFQSLLSPFIILFTVPLAFTGGFLGLYFTGSEISVIAMIGFVMLAGVIVNNGIVLVDYMNQLRENGMEKREAIVTAGRTRLRPVLMTALTTILALCDMVFSKDMGSEMAKPMAVVTIGGLLYGTLLTLFVIPCVYDIFMRKDRKKIEIEEIGEIE